MTVFQYWLGWILVVSYLTLLFVLLGKKLDQIILLLQHLHK